MTATCPLHPKCTIGLLHHNCVRPHTELFYRDDDKSPSPDDGRFPRNRAPPVDPEALSLRAASSAPSSSSATPPAASALSLAPSASSASDISVTFGGPYAGPSWLARRRVASTGARPLQGTERLEDGGGYVARVVFGPQIIEYENGVDYAARLSKPAYFHGYTAIPLGNAPWSVCRRWAKGLLKGAREGARTKDPAKGGERQGAREDAQA